MHMIAAKAIAFGEALKPEFKEYAKNIVDNMKCFAKTLMSYDFDLVSGGTDNHLALVDLTSINVSGRDAADALEKVGIALNKNAIPFDTKSPFITSGIRVGTPTVTARGMAEKEMKIIGEIIVKVSKNTTDESVRAKASADVRALTILFPIPKA